MSASNPVSGSQVVVNGEGHIAGRLASIVSSLLLDGKRVVVVNADKILISGTRRQVQDKWKKRLEISSVVHPKHGPFHPRTPGRIFTRMVRGMIPRRKPSGMEAVRRLRVYVAGPELLGGVKPLRFEKALATKPVAYYVSLGELASMIGWKGGKE